MAAPGGEQAQIMGLRALEHYALSLNEEMRAEHILRILASLKTSTVAGIVDRLTSRLHLDPVTRLPPEIISQIFSLLSPEMLMIASTVSKAWRAETLETSLWRRKFVSEGWYLNISKVLKFEREHGRASARKPLSRRAISDADSRESKRRAISPPKVLSETSILSDVAVNGSLITPSQVGSTDEPLSPMELQSPTLERTGTACSTMSDDLHDLRLPSHHRSLMIKTPSGDSRLDYQKLYRIKSQLEENWTLGRYTAFQFPHRDAQHEAHTECVYTIQFSDKYLVSGSRDRTIRIWNLETCRLIREPLVGHTGSVLSLQFDDSPSEDLIISGSSDKSIGIWRFSTGALVSNITNMHSEAVLCVRFDKRYLASCSKDRLIRIFNRKPLEPGNSDYPIRGVKGGGSFPDYIVDMSSIASVEDFERYLTPEQRAPLEPYTLIMSLEQHSGAVNSLHIQDDKLASGSGDRTAKIFNLRTGEIITNCRAHHKGVACIEYDGARLVTGSSDETIRIFDPATNAEVGKLNGHAKLVRTIQADFADAPGARETLEEDAMLADQAFMDAQNDDAVMVSPRSGMFQDRGLRAASSLRTSEPLRQRRATTPLHNAVGAKLPPGGGGNRWSRIVSGSYDETVLVWRREHDGRWVIGQRYKVADVLRLAGPPLVAASDIAALQQRIRRAARAPLPIAHGTPDNANGHTAAVDAHGVDDAPHHGQQRGAAGTAASVAATTHQGTGAMPSLPVASQPPAPGTSAQTNNIDHTRDGPRAPISAGGTNNQLAEALASQGNSRTPGTVAAASSWTNPENNALNAAAAAAAAASAMHAQAGSARAFKLQFDARRIICCSQDPKIIGWDFAADNKEIIEAAKFFTRTSHYARGG